MTFSFLTAKRTTYLTLPCLLAACGGSTVTGPSQTYETLASTNMATSQLIGRARPVSDAIVAGSNLFEPVEVTGTLDHATGATTIGGFTDSDGPDVTGNYALVVADGSPPFSTTTPTAEQTGTYDYVRTYVAGTGFGGAEGFYGVGTASADMPSSGTATFMGEASGFAPNGPWLSAPTTITANFGPSATGTADITASQSVAGTPASITVTGATITGNALNGGVITATNNGTAVNVTTGSVFGVPISNVNGYFYGYDATNNTPDEVGIEIGAAGADGIFDLTILAD